MSQQRCWYSIFLFLFKFSRLSTMHENVSAIFNQNDQPVYAGNSRGKKRILTT
jgi:hypothetical protein